MFVKPSRVCTNNCEKSRKRLVFDMLTDDDIETHLPGPGCSFVRILRSNKTVVSVLTLSHHRKVLLDGFPMNGHTLGGLHMELEVRRPCVARGFTVQVKGSIKTVRDMCVWCVLVHLQYRQSSRYSEQSLLPTGWRWLTLEVAEEHSLPECWLLYPETNKTYQQIRGARQYLKPMTTDLPEVGKRGRGGTWPMFGYRGANEGLTFWDKIL